MMPKIVEVQDVIATREFVYVSATGEREIAIIEIGKPYQFDNEAFICPYRLGSKSYEKIFGMVGIDSLQALQLTVQTLESELAYWLRKNGGSFEFLDEPGSGVSENA